MSFGRLAGQNRRLKDIALMFQKTFKTIDNENNSSVLNEFLNLNLTDLNVCNDTFLLFLFPVFYHFKEFRVGKSQI